jgi:hypothetical protein
MVLGSSRFAPNCTSHFPLGFGIKGLHVVLLPSVLFYLWHYFVFIFATHFPGATLHDISALKSNFAFVKCHAFPPFDWASRLIEMPVASAHK